MHRELMFTALELMFIALEHMFIVREHKILRCKDTSFCLIHQNKSCHSSHFKAVYTRCLAVSLIIRTFAASN
jgi:hypothetical protein